MSRDDEPFWESAYRDAKTSPWGPPTREIVALARRLPASAPVLDVGCGDGRNSLFLAERGFEVRAFDTSRPAVDKLRRLADESGLTVEAWVGDLAEFRFDRDYGLIIAEGILQFVPAELGNRFLAAARAHTVPGGANVLSVFIDAIEPPEDLAPFVQRMFHDRELRELYRDWEVELFRSHVFEDRHPGGLCHHHACNDLVAFRPR